MIQYLQKVIQEANNADITLLPCSDQEVARVKVFAGGELPDAYLEFLTAMGRGTPNGFLRGHSCFMDEIFKLRKWAEELLDENHFLKKLEKNDFVFWMSQGYLFAFFKLNEGEDPPIYYYREHSGQRDFVRIQLHLSEFLLAFLRQDPDLFKEK